MGSPDGVGQTVVHPTVPMTMSAPSAVLHALYRETLSVGLALGLAPSHHDFSLIYGRQPSRARCTYLRYRAP